MKIELARSYQSRHCSSIPQRWNATRDSCLPENLWHKLDALELSFPVAEWTWPHSVIWNQIPPCIQQLVIGYIKPVDNEQAYQHIISCINQSYPQRIQWKIKNVFWNKEHKSKVIIYGDDFSFAYKRNKYKWDKGLQKNGIQINIIKKEPSIIDYLYIIEMLLKNDEEFIPRDPKEYHEAVKNYYKMRCIRLSGDILEIESDKLLLDWYNSKSVERDQNRIRKKYKQLPEKQKNFASAMDIELQDEGLYKEEELPSMWEHLKKNKKMWK